VTTTRVGATTAEQLLRNLSPVEVELSEEELARLDEVSALTPEHPQRMVPMPGRASRMVKLDRAMGQAKAMARKRRVRAAMARACIAAAGRRGSHHTASPSRAIQ